MHRTIALIEIVVGHARLRADPALQADELASGRSEYRSLAGDSPAIVIHLSPARDVRSWPLRHVRALISALAVGSRSILVLSGPAESAEGEALRTQLAGLPRLHHCVGQHGLRRLAALLTAAAECGSEFIGSDTGPTHLAAACGLRVHLLAGPQDPAKTGPWPAPNRCSIPPTDSPAHQVLMASPSPTCSPCLKRYCSHAEGPVCMTKLQPETVLRGLSAWTSAASEAPSS
jgi:ADP-heptose:LPS heptosyltransferase